MPDAPSSADVQQPVDPFAPKKTINVRVEVSVVAMLERERVRLSLPGLSDVIELMALVYHDKCGNSYEVENAQLLRSTQILEYSVEQLTLANLAVAESTLALEGTGLRTLLQLSGIVARQIAADGPRGGRNEG